MTEIATAIASDLLKIQAVKLSPQKPFTWASGILSPIYTDNRLTISYPAIRATIAAGFAAKVKADYPNVTVIAGVTTAGIPHAAWLAAALDLPMIYVRSKPKDHGTGRQIEGRVAATDQVLVIDDLISTGGSVLGAVDAVQAAGATVVAVGSIFSYQLDAADTNFAAANVPYFSLTNYSALIQAAHEQNYIQAEDLASLKQWRQEPTEWRPATSK